MKSRKLEPLSSELAPVMRTTDAFGSYDTNQPTRPDETYVSLYKGFNFFNKELFDGNLPYCLITLQRWRGAYGYFSGARFLNIDNHLQVVDEIALNPAHFAKRAATKVLSTLVHEMVHLWQFRFGKPGRGRYHNREWARYMNAVGLVPSDTGAIGGKPTGDRVSHYIREGGPFDKACASFLTENATLLYQDRAYCAQEDDEGAARRRLRKAASKTRYVCPGCGLHAWARPGARLRHVDCDEDMDWRAE